MTNALRTVVALACAAALSLATMGCAKEPEQSTPDESADVSADVSAGVRDDSDPTADGRIDVTSTGNNVATFHGPKYIVSDATVDQGTGDAAADGLGLQEVCVVNQPESWQSIGSIGWDRNSISYAQVATAWGEVSYRYEYINEASAVEGVEEWTRTNEQSYFANYDDIRHTQVGELTVAYVYDDMSAGGVGMGIEDIEASALMESDPEAVSDVRNVAVYAYVQRADDCAFTAGVLCTVSDPDSFGLEPEQLVSMAFEPLSFVDKNASVDAASYLSDITIANADGSVNVVLAREGDSLMYYTEHSAMMLGSIDGSALYTTVYDFATDSAPAEGAEEHDVDGHAAYTAVEETSYELGEDAVVERHLHTWVDVDGSMLFIDAVMGEGEDVRARSIA